MARTGYVWDRTYLGHFTSSVAAERPERVAGLDASEMIVDLPGLLRVPLDPHLGLPWIGRVHPRAYIDLVRDAFRQGRRFLDNGETQVRKDTFDVAVQAASGCVSLVRDVMAGRLDNGFAAVRPPGHHAGTSNARGFCYFNNVAIATRYAQGTFWNVRHVLIVDWDVHPADGTMAIFYEDPTVHVVSVHQDGIFTDTVGTVDQIGRGRGEGTTYNVPVPKGSDERAVFSALEPVLERAAARCRPDLVLVSCGFDAHRADPIGELQLSDESYVRLTRLVRRVANDYCAGRLASVLEGGYSPTVLKRCARLHLETLME